MKRLEILALAAASFIPAAALAQTVTPPPEEDTPAATLRTPAPRAGSVAAPAPGAAPAPVIAQPAPPARVTAAPAPPARPAGVTWNPAAPKWAAPAVQAAPAPRVLAAPPPAASRNVVAAQAPVPLPPPPMAAPPPPPPPPPGMMMEPAFSPQAWGEVVEETVTIDADGREHRSVIRRPVAPHEVAEGGILAPYARMHHAPPPPGYWMDPRVRAHGAYGHPRPMAGPRLGRWHERHRDARRGRIPEYVGTGNYRPTEEDYVRLRQYGYPGYGYAQPIRGPVVVETTVTTTERVVQDPR